MRTRIPSEKLTAVILETNTTALSATRSYIVIARKSPLDPAELHGQAVHEATRDLTEIAGAEGVMTLTRRNLLAVGLTNFLLLSGSEKGIAEPEAEPEPGSFRDHLGWWGFMRNGFEETSYLLGYKPPFQHSKLSFNRSGWKQVNGYTWIEDILPRNTDVRITQLFDIYPVDFKTRVDFSEFTRGDHDEELKKIMKRYVDAGHPNIILRLWHEMDLGQGSGRPYGPRGREQQWKDAWKHVVDVMRNVPGSKVEFQFSINGLVILPYGNGLNYTEALYPGNDYVDRVGTTAYDRGRPGEIEKRLDWIIPWTLENTNAIFDIPECGGWDENDRNFPYGHGDNPDWVHMLVARMMAIPKERRGYMLWFNRLPQVDITKKPQQLAALRSYL